MAILKPKSTENTQKNVEKQQPRENQKNAKTEYKLSGAPVCTFILSGGSDSPPVSYTRGWQTFSHGRPVSA